MANYLAKCAFSQIQISYLKTHKTKGAIILFMEQVVYVDFYTKENQSLGIVKDGAGIGRVFLLPPKASVIGTLHYVENNDDLKYLFYFLQSINLARYITGSAHLQDSKTKIANTNKTKPSRPATRKEPPASPKPHK